MNVIEIIVKFWKAMSQSERKQLILTLGELALEDNLVTINEGEVTRLKKGKKSGLFMPTKKYWMRSVTGLDTAAKGVLRIKGWWVNDVETDVAEGEMILVGVKEPKAYYLAKRVDGKELQLSVIDEEGWVDIKNLELITAKTSFKEIEDEIDRILTPF